MATYCMDPIVLEYSIVLEYGAKRSVRCLRDVAKGFRVWDLRIWE